MTVQKDGVRRYKVKTKNKIFLGKRENNSTLSLKKRNSIPIMLINFALKEWLLYEKPVQNCWTLHHKVNSMDPFGMRKKEKKMQKQN